MLSDLTISMILSGIARN